MIVVISIVVILAILMFLRIKVELVYIKELNANHLTYRVSAIYGLISFKRKMEFRIKEEKLAVGVKTESTSGERTKSNIEIKSFTQKTRELLNNFDGLLKFTKISLKKVRLVKSNLICQVGSENAVTTAQLIGLVWTLYGTTMALLQNIFDTTEMHDAKVTPDFNVEKFFVKYECIFDFSLGHFISVAIKFICKWRGRRKHLFIPVIR